MGEFAFVNFYHYNSENEIEKKTMCKVKSVTVQCQVYSSERRRGVKSYKIIESSRSSIVAMDQRCTQNGEKDGLIASVGPC